MNFVRMRIDYLPLHLTNSLFVTYVDCYTCKKKKCIFVDLLFWEILMSSVSNVVEGDHQGSDPQDDATHEDDNNQPQDVEDYEQVTNKKLYLVEAMRNRKKEELAEFVLWKEVLEQVQKMEEIPSSALDVVPSKQKMVAELEAMKEKHLRQHYLYDQLMGVMLASPDTNDSVTSTLPAIYRRFFIDRDGSKYYL